MVPDEGRFFNNFPGEMEEAGGTAGAGLLLFQSAVWRKPRQSA
jgi:hypothetical protein